MGCSSSFAIPTHEEEQSMASSVSSASVLDIRNKGKFAQKSSNQRSKKPKVPKLRAGKSTASKSKRRREKQKLKQKQQELDQSLGLTYIRTDTEDPDFVLPASGARPPPELTSTNRTLDTDESNSSDRDFNNDDENNQSRHLHDDLDDDFDLYGSHAMEDSDDPLESLRLELERCVYELDNAREDMLHYEHVARRKRRERLDMPSSTATEVDVSEIAIFDSDDSDDSFHYADKSPRHRAFRLLREKGQLQLVIGDVEAAKESLLELIELALADTEDDEEGIDCDDKEAVVEFNGHRIRKDFDLKLAEVQHDLGGVLRQLKDLEGSVKSLELSILLRQHILGGASTSVADGLSSLSLTKKLMGNDEDSKLLNRQAMRIFHDRDQRDCEGVFV